MDQRHRLACFVSTLLVLLLACSVACAGTSLPPFDADKAPAGPDYAQQASWVEFPAAPGFHDVDVFWVYPTILHDNEHWLMDMSSPELNRAAQQTIVKQASVFADVANIFAPYYRQMNMVALSLTKAEQAELLEYGMEDVWRAFNHYLKYYNNGRPFILAGHSQGSNILVELMVKHWGELGVEKQLVAGYLIGWSITENELAQNSALKICRSADQTGCFITYNTVAAGRQGVAPTIRKGGVVVNPLTWTTDSSFAPASLNVGAKFFEADGSTQTVPHFTSAQVKDFGLVVEPKDPALVTVHSATFPKGVYHQFDYSLFYDNLRENAATRISAFATRND